MGNDRKLIQALQKYAQGLIDGCECGGSGEVDNWDGKGDVPCEKCAPIRELREEICNHRDRHVEFAETKVPSHGRGVAIPHYTVTCKTCGKSARNTFKEHHLNPTCPSNLTTKLHGTVWYIRHVLEVLGLWERFISWVWVDDYRRRDYHKVETADILTNGTHLRDAALTFMEGVEG